MSTVDNETAMPVSSSWMPEVPIGTGDVAIVAHFASVPVGPRIASIGNSFQRFKHDATTKTGDVILGDSGGPVSVAPKSIVKYVNPVEHAFNISIALVALKDGENPTTKTSSSKRGSFSGCSGEIEYVGGVLLPTIEFENAKALISAVGSDLADPTADEVESIIVAGNNEKGTTGIQSPLPKQTTPPKTVTATPKEKNDTPPTPVKPAAAVNCKSWDGVNYDIKMGKYFILRNMTIGYPDTSKNIVAGCFFPEKLIDAFGMTKEERLCNLQAVAENILDPLYEKIGPFRINSGIRNKNSTSKGLSQHCAGQAVDIQVPGWAYQKYWDFAPWLRDNINYDQFLFEHSERTKLAWLHLSFNRAGNRKNVGTIYRGQYIPGLKKYF